jgi:6-phosphogluconolactonase (cycloisomerase 2 family)
MSKYAYVLEYGQIYCYSIQTDGSLASLGNPVSCVNAIDISYANASKIPRGDDYLFIASNDPSGKNRQGISVYHVEKDGSLTLRVDHFAEGVGSSTQCIVGYWWPHTSNYDIFIEKQGADIPVGYRDDIGAFRFTPPDQLLPHGLTIPTPDTITGDIRAMESVSELGIASQPSNSTPYVFVLYYDGISKKSQVAAYLSSVFGMGYTGSGEASGADGFALVADPNGNFVYVISIFSRDVVGFKVELAGSKFVPLGAVAQLPDFGSAGAVSPDGKYLFVSVAWNPTNDQGVHTVLSFKIGPDGLLSPVDQKPCGGETMALAVEPGGKYLYAPTKQGSIYIYEINKDDGTLTSLTPMPRNSGGTVYGMVVLEV